MNNSTASESDVDINIDSSSSESDDNLIHPLQTAISSSIEEDTPKLDLTSRSTPLVVDLLGDHNLSSVISNRTSEKDSIRLKHRSSSTSNLEPMRRRNNVDSNRKESNSSYSQEGLYFDQRTQRRSRSLVIERKSSYEQIDDYRSDVNGPSSPEPPPQLSEFMSNDKDYVHFLLSGNHHGNQSRHDTHRVFTKQDPSSEIHLQLSSFCTWFSLIAVLILILFGVLIETQPLYIKGISAQRTPYVRVLHSHMGINPPDTASIGSDGNIFSWVHFSGRLRMLDSYRNFKKENKKFSEYIVGDAHGQYVSYEYVQEGKRYHERHLGNNVRFEMKKEAKIAFKTAALYFLTMILSIVYSHNHEYIRQRYRQWNLVGRLTQAILLRRYFAIAYSRFKRRYYSDLDGGNNCFQGRMMRGGKKVNIYSYENDSVGLNLPNKTKINRTTRVIPEDKYISMISQKVSDEFLDHGVSQTVWDDVLGGSKSKKR